MISQIQMQAQDTIQGTSLMKIQAVLPVLLTQGRDLASYRVRVLSGERPAIIFTPEDGETGEIALREGESVPMSREELSVQLAKSEQVDSLRDGSLAPMLAAEQVFRKRKLDLKFYRVALVPHGNSYSVIFTDKDAPSGGRGNPGKRPGFEVEVSAADLHPIRSHFIR